MTKAWELAILVAVRVLCGLCSAGVGVCWEFCFVIKRTLLISFYRCVHTLSCASSSALLLFCCSGLLRVGSNSAASDRWHETPQSFRSGMIGDLQTTYRSVLESTSIDYNTAPHFLKKVPLQHCYQSQICAITKNIESDSII